MPIASHTQAAADHKTAASAHENAAALHTKGDHVQGLDSAHKAKGLDDAAHTSSAAAHAKSVSAK